MNDRSFDFYLPDLLAVALALGSVFFIFADRVKPVKQPLPRASPIRLENEGGPIVLGDGFAENAVYPTTTPPLLATNLKRFGSWLGSNDSLGRAQSAWFRAVPEFDILVAGYPSNHGCDLFVEARTVSGAITRIPISANGNPGESWQIQTVELPQSPAIVRFRITAVDGSAGFGGWVGFSVPFRITGANLEELAKQFVLVLLTMAGALVALLIPGLTLRRRSALWRRGRLPFLWIPVPGFLGLALLGFLCWVGPLSLEVRQMSKLILCPVFLYALYHSFRFPLSTYTSKLERRILASILLLALISIGKAIYSIGPAGELYRGQISRTLEVGGRSDSRIPYHVVQLVASRSLPYSSFAASLFNPFNFSSRGPMVALAASPLVAAAPVTVAHRVPDQTWTVYDRQGFSAYRIVMIVIACCSLTAVFGVAALFLDQEWAFLAFLVTATMPFVVHEIYFTWPKLEAAWFVLLAAYSILCGRNFAGGLLWGAGYLCHPLALLSAPALFGIVIFSKTPAPAVPIAQRAYLWMRRAALIFVGLGLFIAMWALINQAHYTQSGFLSYFFQADGRPLTPANWIHSRWDSVCNTLVPLNLFVLHRTHPSVNATDGVSPPIVQFFFQYWTTLPFGGGIVYFLFLLKFLYIGFIRARAWLTVVFLLPFTLFSVYWGAASTGMLCEGLHAWVVGLMIFSVAMWKKIAVRDVFSQACCYALLFRGVETLLMLLLPAVLTQHKLVDPQFILTDAIALFMMAAATTWLYVSMFRYAWNVTNVCLAEASSPE